MMDEKKEEVQQDNWEVWNCKDCKELCNAKISGHTKNTKLGLYNRKLNELSIRNIDNITIKVSVAKNAVEVYLTCRKCARTQCFSIGVYPVIIKKGS